MNSNWFKLVMKMTKVECGKNLLLKGVPIIFNKGGAKLKIGENVTIKSSFLSNLVGLYSRTIIVTRAPGAEIEIGDNDTLSAIVASMIGADLLILLSDIDGLYTDDPRANPDAEFIETVEHLDESFLRMGKSTTGSGVGTGGMSTKLTAATIATASGADMVIANSKDVRIIHRIIDGENYGTLFLAEKQDAFDLPDFVEDLHSCRERG